MTEKILVCGCSGTKKYRSPTGSFYEKRTLTGPLYTQAWVPNDEWDGKNGNSKTVKAIKITKQATTPTDETANDVVADEAAVSADDGTANNVATDGTEVTCPTGYDNIEGACYAPCPSGYSASGTNCVLPCPPGTSDMGDACKKSGYVRKAVAPAKCVDGQDEINGVCYDKCYGGLATNGTSCTKPCAQGYDDDGKTCQKPGMLVIERPGYFNKSSCEINNGEGSCARDGMFWRTVCPIGYTKTGISGKCIQTCPTGYNATEKGCVKPTIERPSSDAKVCPGKTVLSDGYCYPQPAYGYTCDGPKCSTTCPADGFTDANGKCVKVPLPRDQEIPTTVQPETTVAASHPTISNAKIGNIESIPKTIEIPINYLNSLRSIIRNGKVGVLIPKSYLVNLGVEGIGEDEVKRGDLFFASKNWIASLRTIKNNSGGLSKIFPKDFSSANPNCGRRGICPRTVNATIKIKSVPK